jgi:gluconolactonase
MKSLLRLLTAGCALAATAFGAIPDYPLGPDSLPQAGVPKGELIKFTFDQSKVFPGTTRLVTVYIPKQYDPAKPACVHVNFDGVQFEAPVVFDNLIAKGEMPVVIGVFIAPGVMPPPREDALPRMNRSFEFDRLSPDLARLVLAEILPAVEKQTAPDGRALRLSQSGNDRSIAGSSTGAMAALNAAWQRPDAFTRVFTNIGTFVGFHGGDRFATLVRKTEPKPLRVFLCDGSNDNNSYAGDWWMANQAMQRALAFAGYEVNHVWGEGAHNQKHAAAIFPDVMRWLWKNWPEPVKRGLGSPQLQDILMPGEEWSLVGEGYKFTEGPAANAAGEVFFSDISGQRTFRVGLDGQVTPFAVGEPRIIGQAFGPDGRLYATDGKNKSIVVFDAAGAATTVAEGIDGNDLVVAANGRIYVTAPSREGKPNSQIWLVLPTGEKRVVDTGLRNANGITLSPDQTQLYVADSRSHSVYAWQVQADGGLAHRSPFYYLHQSESADDSAADGMRVDREGRLYVATNLGIQVADQIGRVQAIIPTPNGRVANLCFGGADFSTLYATCGDKVYKRRVKAVGAHAWQPPLTPGKPKL